MADILGLQEVLPALGVPVFAVLDGAQFDDLPAMLLDGEFVCRPLYRNDAINDRDRVRTMPQLVWLDERAAIEDGRAPEITVPLLLSVIADRPAAVFWCCELGGDTLFRHLRRINVIQLPRAALPFDEQQTLEGDHAQVLFRHADANVMAQVLPNASHTLIARILGPADKIIFKPDPLWWDRGIARCQRPEGAMSDFRGLLTLEQDDVWNIERNRLSGLRRRAAQHFASARVEDPDEAQAHVLDAFDRAVRYDLRDEKHIWRFIDLDARYGHRFELSGRYRDVARELSYKEFSAGARLHNVEVACSEITSGGRL